MDQLLPEALTGQRHVESTNAEMSRQLAIAAGAAMLIAAWCACAIAQDADLTRARSVAEMVLKEVQQDVDRLSDPISACEPGEGRQYNMFPEVYGDEFVQLEPLNLRAPQLVEQDGDYDGPDFIEMFIDSPASGRIFHLRVTLEAGRCSKYWVYEFMY